MTVPLLLAVLSLSACSRYRLQAPGHPGVTDRSDVVWSYLWGLVPATPEVDCRGQAIAEVTVESNFAYDLLTVVTLGLVSPKRIEWKCAGATPDEGTIELLPPPDTESGGGEEVPDGTR